MSEIIGIRRMSGKSKKTGKDYAGYLVFYQYFQENVDGVACESAFLSDQVLGARIPQLGQNLRIFYNKNGYATEVELS